ncbi:glutamine-hydrolyzing carbamoyl-phosphate synthase small subunit [Bacteroidia bacterium]|nr:glutamine-hydrolyzing carbamoyl-phosphate synthase small subunit [Bacteroidia bacterium]
MSVINTQKAYLVLQDGKVFEGNAIGKIGTTSGEIAFNTGMTGYQEVFTDPSYFGQIVVMTMDHIGNYGVAAKDAESDSIKIAGLVCKNYSPMHSRNLADSSLDNYFIEHGFTGISDVDTRELVKHIRDAGAMNAIISSEILDVEVLKRMVKEVPSMEGLELSSKVWSKTSYEVNESGAKKVALLDLGSKENIINCLTERGCHVKVFPGDTSYSDMKAWSPDGYMISNGPGDPASMPYAVKTLQEILDADEKMFGICLGSQILAQAVGMKTFKLKKGHRGQNHPVQNLQTGKSEITSQNHGFAIDSDSNTGKAEITHINLNDNTVEGIRIKDKSAFAVQYHPEASPGPHDSRYLFDDFVAMM